MGARISVGRPSALITWVMVKVLPDPVTPSSTWSRSPSRNPCDQLRDRLGLVARRLERRDDLEGAATGSGRLLRPFRRFRRLDHDTI